MSNNVSIFGGFHDLVDGVSKLPLKDQKDLAEDILKRFYEKGWYVSLDIDSSLRVTKTEEL